MAVFRLTSYIVGTGCDIDYLGNYTVDVIKVGVLRDSHNLFFNTV
jgi:hypothetical protein